VGNGDFHLTADQLDLILDDRGRVLSLINHEHDYEFISSGDQTGKPLFGWRIHSTGKSKNTLSWKLEKTTGSDDRLQYWGLSGEIGIYLSIEADGSCCQWNIELTNHGDRTINQIDFALYGPFEFGNGLACTFPYCAGWSIPLDTLEPGDRFTVQYPAKGSMQWVSLYNDEHGLYFGCHDHHILFKELTIGHKEGRPYIRWSFPGLDIQPGERANIPKVVLGTHSESWKGGAQIYRSWATQHLKLPSIPSWYKKNPSWGWVGMKDQHVDDVWHMLSFLPEMSREVAKSGLDLIQLTAYTENGHDTLYPDYVPGDSFGGIEGLKSAVSSIHQDGKFISIYVNGRVVDPASSLNARDRYTWAVRTGADADPLTELYGNVTFDVMCPGAVKWRDIFAKKIIYLLHEFDIDGIYIDQVCGAPSYLCHSTNHDHEKPNQAWAMYRVFLEELRSKLKTIKPDVFLSTEGVNDFLGQYFDSMQAHNDWESPLGRKGIPLDDLFRYTFPGLILNHGCIRGDERGLHYLKLAHLFGGGCDFGVWDWNDLSADFRRLIQRVLGWHEQQHNVLDNGEIYSIKTNRQDVRANAFELDEKIVICAVNETTDNIRQDGEVTFLLPKKGHVTIREACQFIDGNSYPVPWKDNDTNLEISVPVEDIMSIEVSLTREK
jgi:hypothetical protein